jgi:hypothetical protein
VEEQRKEERRKERQKDRKTEGQKVIVIIDIERSTTKLERKSKSISKLVPLLLLLLLP